MRHRPFSFSTVFLLVLVLLSAATHTASADGGALSGILQIEDRVYQNGILSFTTELSGLPPQGQLAATVYSEGGMFRTSAFYPAEERIRVELSAENTDTVKLAWLDDRQRFLAPPRTLGGPNPDTTFTAQLHQLISEFSPAGGAESADVDNPYFLQRLIVKCDILPDLTGQSVEKVLTGPDGLYILSFASPGDAERCEAYIRNQPSVQYVEPDRTLKAETETGASLSAALMDSDSHRSWGVEATGIGLYAENLKERGLARQVTVAVVDSGVDMDHPFLRGRLLPALNASTEKNDIRDNFGHGTHVAGIIADCTQGLDVKILPVKVMDSFGSFPTSSLICGILYAVAEQAEVINLSLSAPVEEEYLVIEDMVQYAISKNITVVAAAGNQHGDTSSRTPARIEDCITVAAVNQDKRRFDLSNRGDAVDLAAPGEAVNSSVPDGKYENKSGTSMAAPHVSAAAALLIYERGTSLTPTQISKTLCTAAKMLPDQTGWKPEFGAGMLDLHSFIPDPEQETPAPNVTISFSANGGTGSMPTLSIDKGSVVTLNKNGFSREYYDFTGWNTKADGTGTPYSDMSQLTAETSLTLYARWIPKQVTISYQPNGGTGSMSSVWVDMGNTVTLNENRFTWTDHTFIGWNTKADGTGDAYSERGSLKAETSLTLYAQWKEQVTISYQPNGGTGTMTTLRVDMGDTVTLSENRFTQEGYTFTGWNTKADGTGDIYSAGSSLKAETSLTLYAQWKEVPAGLSWGSEATHLKEYATLIQSRIDAGEDIPEVVVAVLDTGVDETHPFLSGRILPAVNCSPEEDATDIHYHGTYVAGTIVDNTPDNVQILPIKVLNKYGSGTAAQIAEGIYEAVEHGANVIELALTSSATAMNLSKEDAIQYAISKNVVVITGAGNQNEDTSQFSPARMSECITVSSVGQDMTRYMSNYGDSVDIAAPGKNIKSCIPGGMYTSLTGTSPASSFVAAAAALILSDKGTDLTPAEVESLLRSSATDLGDPGWDPEFGAGFLNMLPFIKGEM